MARLRDAKQMISVADFDRLEENEFRYELDEGELVEMTRPRRRHAEIETELVFQLRLYLRSNPIGKVYGADILYVLAPRVKRAPDVSLISNARLAGQSPDEEIQGAPELCIEILSPNDSASSLRRKISQYFAAGAIAVWVIDPENRTAEIWNTVAGAHVISAEQTLEAPALLPGFALRLADVLPA
jgi:Uma2 family endonuclease